MPINYTRRDFIKLAGTFTFATIYPYLAKLIALRNEMNGVHKTNILILVFDTMSARNLSLYGYHRQTTPNLEKFAERCVVYHACTSAGNYTTPGTASILTGTYPWTHRAINQAGLISRRKAGKNLFACFPEDYHRLVYTQNLWAEYLLNQFEDEIDIHLLPTAYSLIDKSSGKTFRKNLNESYRALDDFLFQTSEKPASLLFGPLEKQFFLYNLARTNSKGYSRGLPHDVTNPKYFRLEDVFMGVYEQVTSLEEPFLAYIHLYPPHEPYRPRVEFENIFMDGWRPEAKPESHFADGSTYSNLMTRRLNYDEYVANVDAEFGILMDGLLQKGILENTILVVTSDHGQLFERGVHGHTTPLLYEPVIHVPLLISQPCQSTRLDIFTPVSNTDILPTLLSVSGQAIPSWLEGQILPGFSSEEQDEHPVFSVEAKSNPAFTRLERATIAMRKGSYKLIYYMGYDQSDWYELYNIDEDPEEKNDIYLDNAISGKLKQELLHYLEESNARINQ